MRGDLFNITGRHPGQSPLNTHRGRGRSQWRWHSPAKYMAHSGQRVYYTRPLFYFNEYALTGAFFSSLNSGFG